jgi:ribonuclease Z
MRLTFLGTGSPMPVADRAQTGSLLTTDNNSRALLVDCGSGVLQRLAATEVGYEDISSVLLTHHHIDHVTDLLPLLKARWLAGETYLEIVGPAGTKRLIDDLLEIHEYLSDQIELRIREVGPTEFTVTDFDIEARRTEHSVDGLAYRITEPTQEQDISADAQSEESDADESATVVFSGDTEATNRIARLADGAAVLVHDCSFPDGVDVSGHPTPSQLEKAIMRRCVSVFRKNTMERSDLPAMGSLLLLMWVGMAPRALMTRQLSDNDMVSFLVSASYPTSIS